MSELLDILFNIKNIKTAHLGATLIDTNHTTAFLPTKMGTSKSPSGLKNAIDALLLYPEVEKIESPEDGEKMFAMCCCWINGFIPYTKGLVDPVFMKKNTATYLMNKSIPTIDQIFKARPDDALHTIFNCFKWNNSNERIVSDEFINSSDKNNLERLIIKGIIHPDWKINPISIKYIIKEQATSNEDKDYLYLIGGSNDVFDINNIIPSLKNIKSNYISQKISIWYSTHEENKLHKLIQSVFLIRNYFLYVKKYLLLTEAIEVDWDSLKNKPIFKKVLIDDIIKLYEAPYNFCKNIVQMYKQDFGG